MELGPGAPPPAEAGTSAAEGRAPRAPPPAEEAGTSGAEAGAPRALPPVAEAGTSVPVPDSALRVETWFFMSNVFFVGQENVPK